MRKGCYTECHVEERRYLGVCLVILSKANMLSHVDVFLILIISFYNEYHLKNFLNVGTKHLFCFDHFVSEKCHQAAHVLNRSKSDNQERC